MTGNGEQAETINPADVLAAEVATRHEELEYLVENLRVGLELVEDLDTVNQAILSSARPDLVITERVEQLVLDHPKNTDRVNNFTPSMRAFGVWLFEERQSRTTGEVEAVAIGRRPFAREERDELFFMGARGSYDDYIAFADEHGLDEEHVTDMLLETHIGHEAFMRMWILMPEFTEKLMDMCLERPGEKYKRIKEEVFAAYSIMSRLVDAQDMDVTKEDGSIDTWNLCR